MFLDKMNLAVPWVELVDQFEAFLLVLLCCESKHYPQTFNSKVGFDGRTARVRSVDGPPERRFGPHRPARRIARVLHGMKSLQRQSVEPMAAHIDPTKVCSRHQSLHHFFADSHWSHEQILLRVRHWWCRRWTSKTGAGGSSTKQAFPSKGATRSLWPASIAGCWESKTTAKWLIACRWHARRPACL